MTIVELLKEALETIEHAIASGDWVVDGANDPDMLLVRIRKALQQKETE